MTMLITAAFTAPLVGVHKRWPRVLHAVEMPEIVRAWPNGTATSACGLTRLRVVSVDDDGTELLVPWPPYVEGLAPNHERCKACFGACKKKRPRSRFGEKGCDMSDTRTLAEELDYMGRRTTDPEASDLLIQAAQEVESLQREVEDGRFSAGINFEGRIAEQGLLRRRAEEQLRADRLEMQSLAAALSQKEEVVRKVRAAVDNYDTVGSPIQYDGPALATVIARILTEDPTSPGGGTE